MDILQCVWLGWNAAPVSVQARPWEGWEMHPMWGMWGAWGFGMMASRDHRPRPGYPVAR